MACRECSTPWKNDSSVEVVLRTMHLLQAVVVVVVAGLLVLMRTRASPRPSRGRTRTSSGSSRFVAVQVQVVQVQIPSASRLGTVSMIRLGTEAIPIAMVSTSPPPDPPEPDDRATSCERRWSCSSDTAST